VAADGRQKVAPNTNLEQISDWLTKILVGVGLVELGRIGPGISNLAEGLAPSLGDAETGYPVAITIMVSFTIAGFIGSYLFTRLRLEGAFSLATFVAQKVEQVEQVKKNIDESAIAASRAEALVENQLGRKGGATKEELTEALRTAPRSARVNAFYLARDQRRANWRDGDLELVERTIPVFEALITCDDRYHRNHGELAYALKDQDEPDYARALAELDKAIALRPDSRAPQYWPYEFNRAWCRIVLDSASATQQPASDELVEAVCNDLEAAAKTKTGRNVVAAEPQIQRWLTTNAAHARVVDLKKELR
jgi:tetratricopeptide (TPR) repeat protein